MNNSYIQDKTLQRIWIDVLLLSLFSTIYFFLFLGTRHLTIPDEGRYPEIAREMLNSGNWVTPTINGVPFLDKPIFYYWIEATSMKLFGVNTWAIRIPGALTGIIGILAIYLFGQRFYNRKTGLLAALVLASSPLYFLSAHYANMDLEVANFLWISFFFFILAIQYPWRSKSRRLYVYIAYLLAACACLTKGLMGIAFPAMAIGIWIIVTNNWRVILQMHIPEGIIIIAICVLPWGYLATLQNPDFLSFYFYYQQIHRFVGTGFNNSFGPWFYFAVIFIAILPWSILIPSNIIEGLHALKTKQKQNNITLLVLIWVISIFVFFTIPASKIIGYIIPIIAPLTLLIAISISRNISSPSKTFLVSLYIISILLMAMSLALIVFPFIHTPFTTTLYQAFIPTGCILFLSGLYSFISTNRKKITSTITSIIIGMMIFNIASIIVVPVFDKKTSQPLTEKVLPLLKANSTIVSYETYQEDLPLLLNQKIYIVHDWHNPSLLKSDNWAREFRFGITQYQSTHNMQWPPYFITSQEFRNLWQNKPSIFVFTSKGNYNMLLNTLYPKPSIVATYRDNVVFTKK
jgi:4-amino-4-deoxy-L-arabinose transferase-like glycosyltransferase